MESSLVEVPDSDLEYYDSEWDEDRYEKSAIKRRRILMGIIIILISALLAFQIFSKKGNNVAESISNVAEKEEISGFSVLNDKIGLKVIEPLVLKNQDYLPEPKGNGPDEEDEEDEEESEAEADNQDDCIGEDEDKEDGHVFVVDKDEFKDDSEEINNGNINIDSNPDTEVIKPEDSNIPTPIPELENVTVLDKAAIEEDEYDASLETDRIYFSALITDAPLCEYSTIMSVLGNGADLQDHFHGRMGRSEKKGDIFSRINMNKKSRKVVYKSVYNEVWQFYILDLETLEVIELPFSKDIITEHPSFSPDGQQIVVRSHKNAGVNISIIDLNGPSIKSILSKALPSPKSIITPQFSKDGKYIFYADINVVPNRILKVRSEGGEPAEPEMVCESTSISSFLLSPNEDKIAYISGVDRWGDRNFVVTSLKANDDSSSWELLISDRELLSWSSSGNYVYVTPSRSSLGTWGVYHSSDISKINIKTGKMTKVKALELKNVSGKLWRY